MFRTLHFGYDLQRCELLLMTMSFTSSFIYYDCKYCRLNFLLLGKYLSTPQVFVDRPVLSENAFSTWVGRELYTKISDDIMLSKVFPKYDLSHITTPPPKMVFQYQGQYLIQTKNVYGFWALLVKYVQKYVLLKNH